MSIENEEITMDEIINKCMDAPGLILFAGVLTNERDKHGKNIIRTFYRRINFSLNDVKAMTSEFNNHYRHDEERSLSEGGI